MTPQPRSPLEEDSFPDGPSHAGSGLGISSDLKAQDQIGSQGKSHRKTNKLARGLRDTLSWIFRTNLPPRRGLPLESVQEREWFGFGDRLNVIVNPSDTLIQLTETRRELQKTQRDLRLRTSPSSCYIPPRTFSLPLVRPSPSQPFLPRTLECSALQGICSGPPAFTVLCGAPTIGKTTLLREALRIDQIYAVIYLDLKVLGADGVEGLLVSLAAALEGFLEELQMTGIGGMGEEEDADHLEKLLRAVKHERRILFHRLLDNSQSQTGENSAGPVVTSNDVSRLLQLFRTSLSLYWSSTRRQVYHAGTPSSSCIHHRKASLSESIHSKFNTRGDTRLNNSVDRTDSKKSKSGWKSRSQIFQFGPSHALQVSHGGATNDSEEATKVENGVGGGTGANSGALSNGVETGAPTGLAQLDVPENQPQRVEEKKKAIDRQETAPPQEEKARVDRVVGTNDACAKRANNDGESSYCIRMPIIIFDDVQRLLSLARSGIPRSKQKAQVLRTLLDGLLVLSKQDRLCHVLHATNDGLHVNWLREMHIDGYKVVTLTDPSKSQIRAYFKQDLLSSIPSSLHKQLKIEGEDEKEDMFVRLYDAFGGRLSHWVDFIGDWVNAGGDLPVERSTPFLHAYTSLNILLLRSCESEDEAEARLELGDDHETLNERNLRDRRDGARTHARFRGRSQSPSQTRTGLGRPARLSGRRHGGMKSSTTLVGAGVNFEDPTCDTNDNDDGEAPPLKTMQFLDLMYRLVTPLTCPRPTRDRSRYFSRTSTLFMQSPKMRLVRPFSTRSGKGLSAFVPIAKDDDEEIREVNGGVCLPIPYFALCREMGTGGREAVDFLVRSKILEVRWGSLLGDREGEIGAGKEMDLCMYGPTLHPSSPVLAHAMRLVLEEYGYQPGVDSVIDLNTEHEHDQEVDLELEPERPIHRTRGHNNIRDNVLHREEQDENERDEFADGEDYEEPPTAVGSIAGRYYGGGGRGGYGHGYGHASGRESSGPSDDKSDYVSFVEDVSEY